MKTPLLFLLLLLTLSTCQRDYVGDYDANYIGEWHSDTITSSSGQAKEIYFIINGDHSEYGFMCELACTTCDCQQLTSGKAVINNKHKTLIIGSGNGKARVRVKIITPPYQNSNGEWLCVIRGGKDLDLTMHRR